MYLSVKVEEVLQRIQECLGILAATNSSITIKMMECAILTIFEADEKEYIALLPLDEKGNASEEGDVYLYRFQEVNGNPTLDNIESDEEYEMVADAFDEWLDNAEFEDMEN